MTDSSSPSPIDDMDEPLGDLDRTPAWVTPSLLRTLKFGLAAAAAVALIVFVVRQVPRHQNDAPDDQLRTALRLLETGEYRSARQIAKQLQAGRSHDAELIGGIQYILGVAAFQDARRKDAANRQPLYGLAARHLTEAERQVLPDRVRPQWAFTLGMCLHQINRPTVARPLLEEALETNPAVADEAALHLADIYLSQHSPALWERVVSLVDTVLDGRRLSPRSRIDAHTQRARALLGLERFAECRQELEFLGQQPVDEIQSQTVTLLCAQAHMAAEEHDRAVELLQPIATRVGLSTPAAGQASYLIGVAYEMLGRSKDAVTWYGRTADKNEHSHEALAACVRMAELLRREEYDEPARDAYFRALRKVRDPRDFRNRWISMSDFQDTVRTAWQEWCDEHGYRWAVDLTHEMAPLLTELEARQLEARAHRLWAEHLERQAAQAPAEERRALVRQIRQRRRQSGHAFAALADILISSSRYPDELWNSAEDFRAGEDFENALRQLTRFINTQPDRRLPLALVRRGEVLMELERLIEAAEHLQSVIENHPSDPAAFEAKFLLGRCHFERNDPAAAEQTWRAILESRELRPGTSEKPGAQEWRWALFALGRLLFYRGQAAAHAVDSPRSASNDQAPTGSDAAHRYWEEAASRLDEFVSRYPEDAEAHHARYLLATCLTRLAERPRRALPDAETDNARKELLGSLRELLQEAGFHYEQLRRELLREEAAERLSELGQQLLRGCHFELAHTLYALERYDESIAAYTDAANKYPEDPHVLLAYMQMSNAYSRLGKTEEARSMLEQAKVIITHIDSSGFQPARTTFTKQEWHGWLDWMRQLHMSPSAGPAHVIP